MSQSIRGSDVFIAEDVLRMMRSIAATHEATRRRMAKTPTSDAYSDGFIDGLKALAESMDIPFSAGVGGISLDERWEW
jgi:hypothetical protein